MKSVDYDDNDGIDDSHYGAIGNDDDYIDIRIKIKLMYYDYDNNNGSRDNDNDFNIIIR